MLLGIALAVTLLILLLSLLVPPKQPLPPRTEDGHVATCEHPQPVAVPVPVTSGIILGCPELFDGRVVLLSGEAIGDLLRGPGGRRWVQVNDDAYAHAGPLASHLQTLGTNLGIAVLLPAGVAPTRLGGPGIRGDLVEVVGTFRAAAAEDQGGPAVIARSAVVVRPGQAIQAPSSRRLRLVTPVAVAITLVLSGAVWSRRRG